MIKSHQKLKTIFYKESRCASTMAIAGMFAPKMLAEIWVGKDESPPIRKREETEN